MSKNIGEYQNLKQLGSKAGIANSPGESVIETVPNPHTDVKYMVRFSCPEFTSLCPITGQPDFAHLVIDYIPNKSIIESKALKLFLHSFRNHNDFHEACTIYIAKRLIEVCKPTWLRIGGYWYPRGGIPIDIFYQTGIPPKDVWMEEQKVPLYSPRF